MILFLAIIVSGGFGDVFDWDDDDDYDDTKTGRSVEVLDSDGSAWCSLPSVPLELVYSHYGHTQSGLEICGGGSIMESCIKFSGGKWKPSHKLKKTRENHSSWASPLGTVLMGHRSNHAGYKTAELLNTTTEDSVILFSLKYETS